MSRRRRRRRRRLCILYIRSSVSSKLVAVYCALNFELFANPIRHQEFGPLSQQLAESVLFCLPVLPYRAALFVQCLESSSLKELRNVSPLVTRSARVIKLAQKNPPKAGYSGVPISSRVIAHGMTDVRKLIEHTSSNHFSEETRKCFKTTVL